MEYFKNLWSSFLDPAQCVPVICCRTELQVTELDVNIKCNIIVKYLLWPRMNAY